MSDKYVNFKDGNDILHPNLAGVDVTNLLAYQSAVKWTSYTAVQDCYVAFAGYQENCNLLDNVTLMSTDDSDQTGVFILKKNQVIQVKGNGNAGKGYLKVYGLKY